MQRLVRIALLICYFAFSKSNFSQDIRGAWIDYKWMSGYTYSININIIIDSANEVNRPTVQLFDCSSSPTFSLSSSLTNSGKFKVRKYSGVTTYGGPGICYPYIDQYLRIPSIKNIYNSQFEAMKVQNYFGINAFMGPNSSPIITSPPIYISSSGNITLYNPGAIDMDGDSLSYHLINCNTSTYYLPSFVSINNGTGTISFTNDSTGTYAFNYMIKEWRKDMDGIWQYIGSTQLDFVVDIVSSVGINEQKKKEMFSFYPNPTSNTLNINTNSKTNSEIEIINCLGEIVLKQKYSENIDVSKLDPGYYFIKINNSYSKFIKE